MPETKSNIVDFELYRRKLRPTDDEIFLEAFELMTEEEIDELIDELCLMFEMPEHANDEDFSPFKTIISFTPEGDEQWGSDDDA